MSARATNSNNYPSVSWADTLDVQWSALRWDVKRAMKSLCSKLEEIGEQCFVVTVNVSNGWVGHLGTIRGDEYIDEKSHILYDFLNYCAESLDYDNCEEGKTNKDLDTESSDVNMNENKETDGDEDDTPIRISRPGPATNETEESDYEDHVIVQTPVQYQSQQPKANLVPSHPQLNNLILLNPIGLPLVTQNVAIATNIPEEQLSTGNQTDKTKKSVKGLSDDQASGNKRKRKQSFEGIVTFSREQKLADNAPRMPRSKIQTESNSKNLLKGLKKDGNHINQADSEETESAESENNSDISESDRVLRSKCLHGYKTRRKPLPRKQLEDDGNSSNNEENDWDNDDDDCNDDEDDGEWSEKMDKLGRFLPSGSLRKKSKNKSKKRKASHECSDDDGGVDDEDDENDEDWSEEMLARDKLGRFLPRKRSKRKRQKARESGVSFDNTSEHNKSIEGTSIADGSEFDKEAGCVADVDTNVNKGVANEKDPVKSDDECVSKDTELHDDKTYLDVKYKSRKRKGKMKSDEKQEKRKSCVESLSDSIDVQKGKDNKDIITEQT